MWCYLWPPRSAFGAGSKVPPSRARLHTFAPVLLLPLSALITMPPLSSLRSQTLAWALNFGACFGGEAPCWGLRPAACRQVLAADLAGGRSGVAAAVGAVLGEPLNECCHQLCIAVKRPRCLPIGKAS